MVLKFKFFRRFSQNQSIFCLDWVFLKNEDQPFYHHASQNLGYVECGGSGQLTPIRHLIGFVGMVKGRSYFFFFLRGDLDNGGSFSLSHQWGASPSHLQLWYWQASRLLCKKTRIQDCHGKHYHSVSVISSINGYGN